MDTDSRDYQPNQKQEDHIARARLIYNDMLSELKALGVVIRHDVPLNAQDPVALHKDNVFFDYKDGPVNANEALDKLVAEAQEMGLYDPPPVAEAATSVTVTVPETINLDLADYDPDELPKYTPEQVKAIKDYYIGDAFNQDDPFVEEKDMVTPEVIEDIKAGKVTPFTPPPVKAGKAYVSHSPVQSSESLEYAKKVEQEFVKAALNPEGVGQTENKSHFPGEDTPTVRLTNARKHRLVRDFHNQYMDDACSTESFPDQELIGRLSRSVRLIHAIFGLLTELGELADPIKKYIYYGKDIDWVNTEEELGDLYWYLAIFHDDTQIHPVDCMQSNIEKLKTRYPKKFSKQKAISRDENAEREALTKSTTPRT